MFASIKYASLGLSALCLFSVSAAAQDFLPGSDAIPVMDGLTLVEGEHFEFDAAEGKFFSIMATGQMTGDAVVSYYDKVLMNLGWQKKDRYHFERHGEQFSLSIEEGDMGSDTEIRFELIASGQ